MTTIPKLSNGLRYGWGANNERICVGAMMGRADCLPEDCAKPIKLNLRRMRLVDGGCYDQGGAYWGQGEPLYRATGDDGENQVEAFARGVTRQQAKSALRKLMPAVKFYR